MPLKVEKNKLTVEMRNAAPILESEVLVTSTRTYNSQIFEALPPQFLFREQLLLVESLLSHGNGVSPFRANQQSPKAAPVSSHQRRLQLEVSKGGSTRFLIFSKMTNVRTLSRFSKALAIRRIFFRTYFYE
ncbi:hypothetical protein AVEN_207247-1 [Araneus ventricosus]|uniref:Uncharacterized protein n=1 Tax=Araneus ventricosus TaxID=182803 RepID=A0A4Y2SCY5_ARAVE|nr:hypothetical protein AVEN_207247-1 [Araneus ventricosus]